MLFDGREIADAARGVHLAHETVANLRDQTRAMLILPIFERSRRRNLEPVEERTVDAHVADGQMVGVNVDPPRRQTDRRPLNDDRLAGDLCLDDGETLREGVIRVPRRRFRPQQIGEVVARELFAGFQRETNEQGEVLTRAKPHLLAGNGEQGGTTEAVQYETVSHIPARVLLIHRQD